MTEEAQPSHSLEYDAPPKFLSAGEWKTVLDALALSGRERQIMRLFIEIESESAIAEILDISVHSVHTYRDRLYRKLNARNRSEAIVRVFVAYSVIVRERFQAK
ncbi:MAG: response regulator transcription factor [Gemmatimonadota bacterium]